MQCKPEGPSVQQLVREVLGTGSCHATLTGIDDYWVLGPLGLVLEASSFLSGFAGISV